MQYWCWLNVFFICEIRTENAQQNEGSNLYQSEKIVVVTPNYTFGFFFRKSEKNAQSISQNGFNLCRILSLFAYHLKYWWILKVSVIFFYVTKNTATPSEYTQKCWSFNILDRNSNLTSSNLNIISIHLNAAIHETKFRRRFFFLHKIENNLHLFFILVIPMALSL